MVAWESAWESAWELAWESREALRERRPLISGSAAARFCPGPYAIWRESRLQKSRRRAKTRVQEDARDPCARPGPDK